MLELRCDTHAVSNGTVDQAIENAPTVWRRRQKQSESGDFCAVAQRACSMIVWRSMLEGFAMGLPCGCQFDEAAEIVDSFRHMVFVACFGNCSRYLRGKV